MKNYQYWLPMLVTIVMNIVALVYITAVFKTTVEAHMADTSAHFKEGEKISVYIELNRIENLQNQLDKIKD